MALRDTGKLAKGVVGLGKGVLKVPGALASGLQSVATVLPRAVSAVQEYGRGFKEPYRAIGDRRRAHYQEKVDRAEARQKERERKQGGTQPAPEQPATPATQGPTPAGTSRSSDRTGTTGNNQGGISGGGQPTVGGTSSHSSDRSSVISDSSQAGASNAGTSSQGPD